jgi:nuclear pore complex protein Nup93
LQPLQDTDVAGYLRIAHEQNLISTIEEARRETQEEFYRVLEERSQKDWEAKKKRVFEELGTRIGGPGGDRTIPDMRASHSKGGFIVSPFS